MGPRAALFAASILVLCVKEVAGYGSRGPAIQKERKAIDSDR
jgi:hypothetical protein